MVSSASEVKIRPIALKDLDTILSIDSKIRETGQTITYANITTGQIFTAEREAGKRRKTGSYYLDLVTGDTSTSLDLGFVAEVEGHVRGFIMGRLVTGKQATQSGQILIVGVHPDYQHRGIATRLVEALVEGFRSRGVKTVRFVIDQRDRGLINLAERMGFGAGHLIDFSRAL
ncbi:MAG: GNAT family N-acetyltransferase [Dehalococcoidales bacterium]|nr:GNAT family N-acetyltransferase [Dehalococcoidales bacterium]